jgi:hypothetical protein
MTLTDIERIRSIAAGLRTAWCASSEETRGEALSYMRTIAAPAHRLEDIHDFKFWYGYQRIWNHTKEEPGFTNQFIPSQAFAVAFKSLTKKTALNEYDALYKDLNLVCRVLVNLTETSDEMKPFLLDIEIDCEDEDGGGGAPPPPPPPGL